LEAPAERYSPPLTRLGRVRWLAPTAAVVAGVLPILHEQVLFPLLVALAEENRSLIPWFQALHSLIASIFPLAIALLAVELYRRSDPGRVVAATRSIGVASGSAQGLMYLLLALTAQDFPDSLIPIDRILGMGIGLWILLTAGTWRRGTGSATFFTGLGILAGVVVIADALGVNASPLIRNVGIPVWFIWLAVRLLQDRTVDGSDARDVLS